MERVLLVVIDLKQKNRWPPEEVAVEMEQLITSCGGDVVERIFCRCDPPTPNYLITKGKLEKITQIVLDKDIDTVIFSHDLKGNQQRNLEGVLHKKTIDRTQMILDIFARHAKSQEGRMQVELAQLEYLLPRLVGRGIELSRLGGGIGTVGPGETKLEVDRRRISQRITKLKRELQHVSQARQLKRKRRKEQHVPTISLVGYTNAGKSTLLNALTNSNQRAYDGLFTTLDPLARQWVLPNHQKVVLSDTVGFMYELPHRLIESFKATLEEVQEADILLHVLDVSNPRFRDLNDAVIEVLQELECQEKPIITVFNKIDKLSDNSWLKNLKENFPNSVCVSAKTGENLEELSLLVTNFLTKLVKEIKIHLPLTRMDLVNLVHKEGQVKEIEYTPTHIAIHAFVPLTLFHKLGEFLI